MSAELANVASSLLLDHLAVQVSRTLQAAGLPHALIKGVTTSRWLYPEGGRRYRDVDLLVPAGEVGAVAAALKRAGVVTAEHARLGELAPHSLVLTAPSGLEVDVHVALPAAPPVAGDQTWQVLRGHLEPFDLDGEQVPALDDAGRCLMLAMHVLVNGGLDTQSNADLRRALDVAGADCWATAGRLADEVGLLDHLEAAVDLVQGHAVRASARDITLRVGSASASVLQLDRILRLPWRERWTALGREAFPSRAFMVGKYPDAKLGPVQLVQAYLRRHRALVRQVPALLVVLGRPGRPSRSGRLS